MSGVNCRRRKSIPSARAVALASSVLATPGHALEQHVAAERERGEHVLERLVVADDDLADLARDAGVQLLHERSSLSGLARTSAAASASTYSTRGGGSGDVRVLGRAEAAARRPRPRPARSARARAAST